MLKTPNQILLPWQALALPLVFLELILASACRRPTTRRPAQTVEAERRETMSRFRQLIESVAGSQVWVRSSDRARGFPPKADSPVAVLVARGAYDKLLGALRRESAQRGLEAEVRESGARDSRIADISLRRHGLPAPAGQLVGRWQLREVRRLYRAAIVIDDLGQDSTVARTVLQLPYPIVPSILPHLPHSTWVAQAAEHTGLEVLLHLPMEPASAGRPAAGSPTRAGPGEIRVGMSGEQVALTIDQDLASVPRCVGVNNHMGSRATADVALMTLVMKLLRERGLYFVDSRTTPRTVAFDVARRYGVPAFYRSVFLDDTPTLAYTLGQLRRFEQVVQKEGVALAIGHPYPSTLAGLAKFLPELERHDIRLVPVSQLVNLPEVAHLSPPPPPR